MYDSKRIKKQDNPITLDYILSKVTEYDIYARYLGQFKVGFIYNSPFRKDKNSEVRRLENYYLKIMVMENAEM